MTGVTVTPPPPPADDAGSGASRGVTELLIGALAGSALLPFIQAMATRAGEDAYELIRGRLSREGRRRAREEIRAAGTVTVADRGSRVVLQLPRTVDPAMAARLDRVRLPARRTGWLLIRWDAGRAEWLVETRAEPPPAAGAVD